MIQTDWFTIRRNAYAWSLVKPFEPVGVGALVFSAAFALYGTFTWGPIRGLRSILVGVGVYAAFTLYEYRNAWERVGSKADVYDIPRRFNFSEAGIGIEMQGKKPSLIPWSRIEKIEHRAGHTFLVFEKTRHYPIPDDAFVAKDQIRELPKVLRRWVAHAG